MTDAMSWFGGFVLCLSGLGCLAAAQARHATRVFSGVPDAAPVRSLRWTGALLSTSAALWCIDRFGTAIGLIGLAGLVTIAGWTVALILTARPRWLARALPAIVVVATVTVLVTPVTGNTAA